MQYRGIEDKKVRKNRCSSVFIPYGGYSDFTLFLVTGDPRTFY
jgi:hypothetical protein